LRNAVRVCLVVLRLDRLLVLVSGLVHDPRTTAATSFQTLFALVICLQLLIELLGILCWRDEVGRGPSLGHVAISWK
jgi:hypothetical protein